MLSQPLIDSFVESHSSYNTRKAYRSYLKKFKEFLDKGNIIFDTEFRNKLIVNLNNTLVSPNPYSLLKSYYLFLQKEYEDLNPKVKDAHHYTAFSFFYANDIIINTKYLNKSLQHNKEEGTSGDSLNSVSKKFIIKFLNHCNDKRLKLWVLWLASTGWRAEEPLLLRWRDILEPSEDFPQPRAYLKSSKTDRRRIRPIPHELYDQLMIYKKDKYSPIHTTVLQDNGKRKMYYGNRLEYDPDQLIFSTENEVYKAMDETKKIRKEAKEANKKVRLKMERKSYNIYKCLWRGFNRVRQNLDINDINEENLRNEFVPNSFRHYVRTYVNKLVNRDFSEWYIGHKISTYDDLRVNEGMSTLEDFKIIEKEFTFLDATILDNTLKEERERIKKLEEDKVKQLKDIEELKQKIELQKNHDEELRNEIKQVKKNRMIDLFEIEFSNMTEEIQNNYEDLDVNLSPATPEMPKIIIKEISEKIRNKKPNVENIPKQLVNETLEKRQNVKLEDIAFITPKLIIDRMKQFHSISDDELLLLDEHIREIIKHETDDINNEILAYKHLPTELMFNLTFQPN